ncbi:MAG: hypothetical protein Q9M28_09180 [Mariprofundaceae bacterium]|nr:hypothetical protein [Mariprofundaceae bacterium]
MSDDENNIVDEINKRLSSQESPYGYVILNDGAKEKIGKFIKSMEGEPPENTIKLRPRKQLLFSSEKLTASDLYEEIFSEIKKESSDNGDFKISCPLMFDITFNKDLIPKHKESNVIKLGETSVLYLLYINPSTELVFQD